MASAEDRYAQRGAASDAAWATGNAPIDVSDLNALAIRIDGASTRAVARADIALRKTSNDIVANAKVIAPVDTGYLRNSIGYDMGGGFGGLESRIGPTAAYGYFLEVGTSRMAPRAFMGPSLDRYSGAFETAMAQIAAEEAL